MSDKEIRADDNSENCTECGLLLAECTCKTLVATNVPARRMTEVKGTAEQRKIGRYTSGQLINGRYVIKRIVGIGGMGTVYEASHVALEVKVALKTLKTELIDDALVMQRFEQEARACAGLKHPNLVDVYDCGVTEEGEPYLVMEFLEGRHLLDEFKSSKKLDLNRFFEIFLAVLSGLEHAHGKSVIHRDLKPGNIIITAGPKDTVVPKIVDFGMAKVEDLGGNMQMLTQTGEVFGSPSYMSPEQCSGSKVDQRSDIYSLGCIMYEALCGKQAFYGENILSILDKQLNEKPKPLNELVGDKFVPEALVELVEKCLEKDPDNRFQSSTELYKAMEEVRDNLVVSRTFTVLGKRFRFETLVGALVSIAVLLCIVNFQHLIPSDTVKRLIGVSEKKVEHLNAAANKMLSDLTYADFAAESFVLDDAIPLYNSILDTVDSGSSQAQVAALKSMIRCYARVDKHKEGAELFNRFESSTAGFEADSKKDLDNVAFAANLVLLYQYAAFCNANIRKDFQAENLYLKAIRLADELNVPRWIQARIHLEYSNYLREVLQRYKEAHEQAVKAEKVILQIEDPAKREIFKNILADAYCRQCWTSWAMPDFDQARAELQKAIDIYVEARNKSYVSNQYDSMIQLFKQEKKKTEAELAKAKKKEVLKFIDEHPRVKNLIMHKRINHHPDQLQYLKRN